MVFTWENGRLERRTVFFLGHKSAKRHKKITRLVNARCTPHPEFQKQENSREILDILYTRLRTVFCVTNAGAKIGLRIFIAVVRRPDAEILVEAFDVYRHDVADVHIAHNVLDDVIRVRYVEVRENALQHVHGAADRGDCHLFAGRAGDDELARGKEQRRGLGLVDADRDGCEALLVVRAVGDAPRYHVEVDLFGVGFDVNRRHHVVCRGCAVLLVGAEFLAHVLVVQALQQPRQALFLGQVLVLLQRFIRHHIRGGLLCGNVAILAFAHVVAVRTAALFLRGHCIQFLFYF